MADTKISALTAAGSAAAANEFAINEAGTSKKVTGAQIKTLVNTAPLFAAGSASANTWPKLTTGTLLTTPEAGAIEMADDVVYVTAEAGNRGSLNTEHWIIQSANRTLSNVATEQKLFDSVANGTLALAAGRYFFEMLIGVTGLSATSGNAALDILGAGSATMGTTMYANNGIDSGTVTNSGTQTGSLSTAAQGNASVLTAGTGATMWVSSRGMFTVTAAGTIIPSITLVTAAAGTLLAGSFFRCHRVGNSTALSVGEWT
jgi:hypothetical protein